MSKLIASVTDKHVRENDRSVIPPYKPKYDTSSFVNDSEFFDKHPGVIPNVTSYENHDAEGNLIESWERNDKGVMINTTKRDKLRKELIAAQEALAKIKAKEVENDDKCQTV